MWVWEAKNHCVCEKKLYLESCYSSCENGKYSASIIDSVITCDEIIEEKKTVPTSFNETKQPVKQVLGKI